MALRKDVALGNDTIPPSPVSERVRSRIDVLIADIDRRVGKQLDAILHHPAFRAMERAWRSAWLVVDQLDGEGCVRLQLLQCTKQELVIDFEDAPTTIDSGLYKLVGDHRLDEGAVPMTAFIADYEFGAEPAEIALLRECAALGSFVHAPFIAGVAPALLGVERFEDLVVNEALRARLESPDLKRFVALRQSADANHVALTLPRALLRGPHHVSFDGGLRYQEQLGDTSERLWGNAAFAFATRILDSFQLYGWSPNVIGPKGGGLMKGLAAFPFKESKDGAEEAIHISTERPFSERAEFELSELGFIPLTCNRRQPAACFYSANSVQQPKYFGTSEEGRDAELNFRLGTQLPYMFITNRIADYLKVVHRIHIGAWSERAQIERQLNMWAGELVAGRCVLEAADRSRRMLRKVKISVEDMDDERGWYKLQLKLRPFFKYMGAFFTLGTVGKLDKR